MKNLPKRDGIGRELRIPQRSTEAAIGIALARAIELIIENIEENEWCKIPRRVLGVKRRPRIGIARRARTD